MTLKINAEAVLNRSPIIPVMVIQDINDAIPLGQALINGGISVFEVTLRTRVALEAIARLADRFPEALVGAGTVLDVSQFTQAVNHGAQFIISPGFTSELLDHGKSASVPLIPGVTTASEVMQARQAGYRCLKFFPAEANGGAKALKALTAPIQDVTICPTGGITEENMGEYLSLSSVPCVGGSWIIPEKLIRENNWSGITNLTHQALAKAAQY